MNTSLPNDAQFNKYYQKHVKYLRLKGLRPKTIEAYTRAIRRIGNYFDARIDHLTSDQLLDYFNDLLQSHSWSAVKLDLYGLKFFYTNVSQLTGPTVDSSDARCLLQNLFVTDADILPDPENKQLNIRVHSASRPAANRAIVQLLEHLNRAEVKYPGTQMRMVYEIGGFSSSKSEKGVK